MFDNHQPIISRWARAEPENMRDVIRFVLLTIRYPLLLAAEDMAKGDTRGLYGSKYEGWYWLEEHYHEVYNVLEALHVGFPDPADSEAFMLEYLACVVPGLGLVKAGFVLQLAYGVAGCLDSHNLKRFGLSPWPFAHVGRLKTQAARLKRCRKYLDTCKRFGGARELWDTWCQYVADRDWRYTDAMDVSRYHLVAFGLEETACSHSITA